MGYQLKRVPQTFDWPLNETWAGYENPYHMLQQPCEYCYATGYSPQAEKLAHQWYGRIPFDPKETGSDPFRTDHPIIHALAKHNCSRSPDYERLQGLLIAGEAHRLTLLFNNQWCHHLEQADVDALVEAGRLLNFTHVHTRENGYTPKDPPYRPTAKEVNEWSLTGFGHDAFNRSVCIEAKCKRLNIDRLCKKCNGTGNIWNSKAAKQLHDEWKPIEPPTGESYQMWETISEGSSVSPQFETPELLAKYMAEYHIRDGNYDQWLAFINGPGRAPSFVTEGEKIMSGVEAVTQE